MVINYILVLIVCYLGLIGGFIVRYFAKEELKNIKSAFFVKKSEFVYAILALLFYFSIQYEFFQIMASIIFLYGIAVGALKNEKYLKILFKNAAFLVIGLLLILTKSL